jgi:myo-inositol-hexaphosphate 3-phosphohydrolase
MAKLKDHQWYHNTNEWTSQTPLRPVGNSNAALNAGCLFLTSDTDADYLQEDLDKLAEWEGKWKMAFHPDKCNVLTITHKRKPIVREYQLHGHTLEAVKSTKYLECTISADLKWNDHIRNICNKANKTIGFL